MGAASVAPLEVITLEMTDNNTQWSDLAFLPGGFKQSHAALQQDAGFKKVLDEGYSGEFLGYRTCHVEWYVPPCAKGDVCVQKVHNSWEMPFDMDVVFHRHHFHNAAINATTVSGGTHICSGIAAYDANGFLEDISTCMAGREIA